jgi:putative PIN family toxin of toxin-antitoxin system
MNGLRAVLDTNIIVSAFLSPTGNPAKVYKMFLAGILTLVYSQDILSEYQDVLYRPHLQIPVNDVDIVFKSIRQHGELVVPIPSTVYMVDEDDRAFYDAAKSSSAYLITGNTRHYPQELFIVTPAEFLDI